MQCRIIDKITTRSAKYDLLSFYWDSTIKFIQDQGIKKFDDRLKIFA